LKGDGELSLAGGRWVDEGGALLVVVAGVKGEAAVPEFVGQAFEARLAVCVGAYLQI